MSDITEVKARLLKSCEREKRGFANALADIDDLHELLDDHDRLERLLTDLERYKKAFEACAENGWLDLPFKSLPPLEAVEASIELVESTK